MEEEAASALWSEKCKFVFFLIHPTHIDDFSTPLWFPFG
jgi:hypothetical protein